VLKIILIVVAVLMFYYGGISLKKGKIYIKEKTYEKVKNPLSFWISIIVIMGFGLMLLFFGLFGKIQ